MCSLSVLICVLDCCYVYVGGDACVGFAFRLVKIWDVLRSCVGFVTVFGLDL